MKIMGNEFFIESKQIKNVFNKLMKRKNKRKRNQLAKLIKQWRKI